MIKICKSLKIIINLNLNEIDVIILDKIKKNFNFKNSIVNQKRKIL